MAKKPAQVSPAKPATPSVPKSAASATGSANEVHIRSSAASTLSPRSSPQQIALHVWNKYLEDTPPRTMMLDAFMFFLVLVGAVQFLYCLLAGNYPFNAFLSGFCAAVGQFVLTASLRMQTTEMPSKPTAATSKPSLKTVDGVTGVVTQEGQVKISSERAFADFVFGSLILHAFCINFIN